MESTQSDIKELHWLMDMLQTIDTGLVVLDKNYAVQLWNGFMENHSGLSSSRVLQKNLFELFPDIPERWLKHKLDSVFMLQNRSFITWEQRPYLLRFKNYRPITGIAEFMYQNITLIPLVSVDGSVSHVCVIIYDVTDAATNKLQLETVNTQLETLSRTDRLTGLFNRGYWEERLRAEFARCQRTGATSSLVMFDIDHFKKVNDTYGHPAGDEVIRRTAEVVQKTIRTTDIAGRYGGEEFGIILIETDAPSGHYLAERIRKRIEALQVAFEDMTIPYTISLGVSEFPQGIDNYETVIKQADQALYTAKESGRNQAVIYTPE